MYIVFEGIVGTGKTAQSKRLVKYLKKRYKKGVVWTREPGGTEIAEAIRKLAQGTKFKEEMDSICECYLYAAARAQSLRKIVKTSIKSKAFIISDRSFISSITIQGFAKGMGIEKVFKINSMAVENLMPDLVFYIKLDPNLGLLRVQDKDGDKFENNGVKFYRKVQKGYELVSKMKIFKGKWINIDGRGNEEVVFSKIVEKLEKYLK